MAKRTDSNQKELVAIMRNLGASVLVLSEVGKGCPDLLLGVSGKNALVELKDGNKPPSQRKLTPAEQQFFDEWRGQVCIITTVAEVVTLINHLRG
jgi:hypothetical protein